MAKLQSKWLILDNRVFAVGVDQSLHLVLEDARGLEITADGLGIKAEGVISQMIKQKTIEEDRLKDTYIRADGQNDFSADQSMAGHRLTNLGAPTDAADAVNMQYVRDVINGIDRKDSVYVSTVKGTTYAFTDFIPGFTLDGVVLTEGMRILVKDLPDPVQNGIYDVTDTGIARSKDADGSAHGKISTGMTTFIEHGDKNKSTTWSVNSQGSGDPRNVIIVGTDPTLFTQTGEAGELLAGNGLRKDGLVFNVIPGPGLKATPKLLELVLDAAQLDATTARGLYIVPDGVTQTELKSSSFGSGLQGGSGAVVKLGVLTEDWDLGGNFIITGLKAPTQDSDATNKRFVTDLFLSVPRRKTAIITLTPADIVAKIAEIGETKAAVTNMTLNVQGGIPQLFGVDFTTCAGANGPASAVTWEGLFLETILEAGDTIHVQWDAPLL